MELSDSDAEALVETLQEKRRSGSGDLELITCGGKGTSLNPSGQDSIRMKDQHGIGLPGNDVHQLPGRASQP
jgi:hypothetical protein